MLYKVEWVETTKASAYIEASSPEEAGDLVRESGIEMSKTDVKTYPVAIDIITIVEDK